MPEYYSIHLGRIGITLIPPQRHWPWCPFKSLIFFYFQMEAPFAKMKIALPSSKIKFHARFGNPKSFTF